MFQEHQTTSSINNLISRLSSVQHDLDNLTQVTNDLKDEQEQRQMIIDVSSTNMIYEKGSSMFSRQSHAFYSK